MKCPCCNGRGRVPNVPPVPDPEPTAPTQIIRDIARDLRCALDSYARRQGKRLDEALDKMDGACG